MTAIDALQSSTLLSAPAAGPAIVDHVLVDRVRGRLASAGLPLAPKHVSAALRAEGRVIGDELVLAVYEVLQSDAAGAGPLTPFLRDPDVTDILVNGPDDVWVDRGAGLQRVRLQLGGEASVRRLAQRLAGAAGRRLDDASPYTDGRLPIGVRMHAVLPPIAPGGTCICLRVARHRSFTLDELVQAGTVPREGADVLKMLVASRCAFLVIGGTGTGKTTVLSTLLALASPAERLVLVEDSGELRPDHPHVVRLESRPPNLEGAGVVTMRDLVRQALRMRPDRLVVGEVRGAEVVELLAALNTGHEGGCGTLHANAPTDVPARVEALAVAAGLNRAAAHSQLAAGLDAVLHLVRDRDGRRVVRDIGVLEQEGSGLVRVVPALAFHATGIRELAGSAKLESVLARRLP
jgi:pilus assembly protein CpaF